MKNLTYLLLLATTLSFSQVIEDDKVLHLQGGAIISPVGYIIGYGTDQNRTKAIWYGIGSGTFVGLLKEVTDIPSTGFNGNDLFATISGAVVSTFATDLVNGLIQKRKKKRRKLVIKNIEQNGIRN